MSNHEDGSPSPAEVGSSSTADAPIESAFMSLVEEYIAAYPLTAQGSLAHVSVCIVAGKLMLHRRMMKQTNSQPALWAGEGSVRVAAIMLVLFVQECLVHNRKSILGFIAQDWYELLSAVVRDSAITREELMVELIDVDLEGSATQLASSAVLSKLWDHTTETPEPPTLHPVTEASGEERESDNAHSTGMLPELATRSEPHTVSAREPRLASPAAPIYHATLFRRTLRLRMACTACTIIWIVSIQFHALERFFGKDVEQVAPFCLTILFSQVATAAYFPTNLADHSNFTNIPAGITALMVWVGVTVAFFFKSESQVNLACKGVHGVLCLATGLAWSAAFVLSLRGEYTWRSSRLIFLFDGVAFGVGTLALRALGPPPSYPPGNVSLEVAFLRAFVSVALSCALMPAVRQRLAALAKHAGLWDVTVNLGDLKDATARDEEQDVACAGATSSVAGTDDSVGTSAAAEGVMLAAGEGEPALYNPDAHTATRAGGEQPRRRANPSNGQECDL